MNKELKEQAHKEFEQLRVNDEYYCGGDYENKEMLVGEIKSFIDSLIDKTVQMTEERIWKEVKKVSWRVSSSPKREYNVHREDIKNILTSLITNKSDINK